MRFEKNWSLKHLQK